MKRFLALTLSVGLLAPITLVGCGEKSDTQVERTTPEDSATESTTVEQAGENPPPPGEAEPAPAPAPAPTPAP